MPTPELEPEPLGSPQVRNLEIRGTWDGEVNGRAELRISLEIQGTPNTQIQILDTRSPTVLLCKTSIQFLSEEWGHNSQPEEVPPQSPLFEFFEPNYPDGEGAHRNSKGFPEAPDPMNDYAFVKAHSETSSTNHILYPGHKVDSPLESSLMPDERSPGLRPNFAKRNGQTRMLSLGKRSAADACLTDVESNSEDAQPDRKLPYNGTIHNLDTPDYCLDVLQKPAQSERDNTMDNISQQQSCSSREDHSKPALLSEMAVRVKQASDAEKCLVAAHYMQTPGSPHEKTTANASFPRGKRLHTTSATKNLCKTKDKDTDGHDIALTNLAHSNIGQERVPNDPAMPPISRTRSVEKLETDLVDSLSTRSASQPDTEQEAGSGPDNFERNPIENYEQNPGDTHEPKHREFSENEPEINMVDDILFVQYPANVRAGVYKVVVSVSIALIRKTPMDWYDLVIPGLPKLGTGESGFILFLIPDKYGVEFRTTYLRRFRMVEDCLFAEFVDKRDLVIPMRSFDQRNYGIVKGFVVDQEIEARPLLISALEDNKHTHSGLSVRYHAMCSLRLHERCFWAEKCCFFLDLDGGPEGFFQCKLQPPDTSLQVVYIPSSSSYSIGVSHLQIICSPRDLGMFCITWLVKMPFLARNWLPRIYPGSTSYTNERDRGQLRATFTRLYANAFTEEQSYQCIMSALERGDETDGRSEAVEGGDWTEDPERTFRSQYMNTVAKAISRPLRALWTPINDPIPTWRASRKNLFILTLVVAFTICGTLSCLLLSPTYSGALSRPCGPGNGANAGLLDKSRLDGQIPGCGEPSCKYKNFTEELFDQAPDNFDSASLFDNNNTSKHVPLNQQEAIDLETDVKRVEEQEQAEEQTAITPGVESGKVFSLRDQIDHFLGWKGPIDRMA
ncbi:hypothetical protein BDV38DRAFT_296117 [Aspergillus pseudotamarii]|uniref:Uncharacterized protein n=1 Tax=Aspergillus pseudotamarii TaxID=132259 RepID=A0A5N6SFM2_ASPPS|nr:uncharacterized protein BDV38DRAFT_296117 [Aspergillus pseudotamarii]KAE8133405.1 hypothetical protein BDV38DRAFT_296117 [Aspergillus pseudotamarii]